MFDQIIIGGKASFDDFEASVRDRVIKEPAKKEIKDTVPYSNLTYDFSAINGEVYWEERELEYNLEIMANSPEEMEEKKRALKSWLMNVMQEELHDPFIKDYHFIATFKDISFDDSEFEKTTGTVIFTAYPYMIANAKQIYEFNIPASTEISAEIANNSSHRITPTFTSNVPYTLTIGERSISLSAGEIKDSSLMLATGLNEIKLQGSGQAGTLTVEFREEVF